MGEKVASLYAEVTAETGTAQDNLRAFRSDLEGTGNSLGSFGETAISALQGVALAIGGAVEVGVVMKQVFDFGAQGAQVMQVESAFNSLLDTLGGAPGTLEEMRSATQGTVADLDLMAASSKLLAGVSGELGAALAMNLPQLWAIANAASDLNPALGSAAEMFGRITTAIQTGRASSLAQIGIAIKMGDAYDEFGQAVEQSGSALTKEQQQQALLNAVLKTGVTVVEQASRVNDGAADSIDRMNAALTNAGNAVKAAFAPGIAQAAEAVTVLLTQSEAMNRALSQHNQEVARTAGSYGEYIAEMQRAANVAGLSIGVTAEQAKAFTNARGAMAPLATGLDILSEAEWEAQRAARAATTATMDLGKSTEAAGLAAEGAIRPMETAAMGIGAMREQAGQAALAAKDLALQEQAAGAAAEALAAGLAGTIQEAMASYSEAITGLAAEQATLTGQLQAALAAGWSPTSAKVSELNSALGENKMKQEEAARAMQLATAQMIYQQASAGLDAAASLELARSLGVLSESDYAVSSMLASLKAQYDANADGAISAAEGAGQFAANVNLIARAVGSLQARNAPVTMDSLAREMQALASATASGSVTDTMGAIGEAAGDIGGFAEGMRGAADNSVDLNSALDDTPGAAGKAAGSIDGLVTPLSTAAGLSGELADALGGIKSVKASVQVNPANFQTAIDWVNRLGNAINGLPASRTISITVNASSSGTTTSRVVTLPTTGTQPGEPQPQAQAAGAAGVQYHIYNPLAAAILAGRQWESARERVDR